MTSGELVIWDDDFGWDATIKVAGDFYGPDKLIFLEAIAKALNACAEGIPTRRDWELNNPELAYQIMHGSEPSRPR